MNRIALTLALTAGLTGCATDPDNIGIVYNDPTAFRPYSCEDLQTQIVVLDDLIGRQYEQLDSKAFHDRWQLLVGPLVGLPVGFGLDGSGSNPDREIDYGRLKGRAVGLRREAVRKQCPDAERYGKEALAIEDGDYDFKVSGEDSVNTLADPNWNHPEYSQP